MQILAGLGRRSSLAAGAGSGLRGRRGEGNPHGHTYKLSSSTEDPAIAEHHRIMNKYSDMPPSNYTIMGQLAAELTVEALSRTCNNLTREGLMDAVHSFQDYQSDLMLPGISISLSPTDHLAIEAMGMMKGTVTPEGKGKWEYFGDVIPFRD
jgi:hypothetical protein